MLGKDILVLYGHEWDYVTGRCQQVAKRLAAQGRVVYVEMPVSLLTALSHPKKLMRFFGRLRRLNDSLFIYTAPPVLPFSTAFPLIMRVNSWAYGRFARRILHKVKIDDYFVLSYSPLCVNVLDQFEGRPVFYECVDDYAGWMSTPRNRRQIERDEPRFAALADAVIVVSRSLEKKFRPINKNTYLVPNGVEVEHFRKSREDQPKPHALQEIEPPILGFIGSITTLIDVDLMIDAAKARPDWSFVVVGPILDKRALPKLKNLHFLGCKPYSELPAYLGAFDVCLIPLNQSFAALSANPAKVFQYFASGKPVVGTDVPELAAFSDLIYISRSAKEFIENIAAALAERDEKKRHLRIAVAEANTWDNRVNAILDIMATLAMPTDASVPKERVVEDNA